MHDCSKLGFDGSIPTLCNYKVIATYQYQVMGLKSLEWIFYPLVFKSCRTPFAWASPRTYEEDGVENVAYGTGSGCIMVAIYIFGGSWNDEFVHYSNHNWANCDIHLQASSKATGKVLCGNREQNQRMLLCHYLDLTYVTMKKVFPRAKSGERY